ncbi:MAG TPA: hypothetical protein VL357_03145 [Rariglobus sp.]|jgi:hypothetical protein|nr:hypothetical protein [Rariglobus sp.]
MSLLLENNRRLFFVPAADRELFDTQIPKAARARCELLLCCMERIHLARNRKAECSEIARRLTHLRGCSAPHLKRFYLAFRASGNDWRKLVAAYHLPAEEHQRGNLSPEFVRYWQALAEENQRAARPAYRELLRRWRRGDEIAGVGTWQRWWQAKFKGRPLPAECPEDLPTGWSYENLLANMPAKVETTIVRDGLFAAHAGLSQILRDRNQLRPHELLTFDDAQLDFRVMADGGVRKLRGVFCLDVGDAYLLSHYTKPALAKEDGGEEGLMRAEVRQMLFYILRDYGIPRDYPLNLLVESGAASISKEDAAWLHAMSGGRIIVHRTSVTERTAFLGAYTERYGQPWHKGWIEAFFNLLHNECAGIAGQFGRNQLEGKTGDFEKRKEAALALYKAAECLPAFYRDQLATPFPSLGRANDFLIDVINRINHRQDHRLQGFERVSQWRLTDGDRWRDWAELRELPAAAHDAVQTREVMESPAARHARRWAELVRDPLSELSLIPLLNAKRTVTLAKPFEVKLQIDGKGHVFRKIDKALAKEGLTFTAHFDEDRADCIHLFDEAGRHVATLPRVDGFNPLDRDAYKTAIKATAAGNRVLLDNIQQRTAGRAGERLVAEERNREVLETAAADIEAGRMQLNAAERASLSMQAGAAEVRTTRAASKTRSSKKQAAMTSKLAALAQSARDNGA